MSFPGVDQTIVCKDCRNDFVFTVGEQNWFTEKGLDQAPKRCKQCRSQKRTQQAPQAAPQSPPPMAQRLPENSGHYQAAPPPSPPPDDDWGDRPKNKKNKSGRRRRHEDDDYEW
jgi:hypothetical protein